MAIKFRSNYTKPPQNGKLWTLSDTSDLPFLTRGIWVGGAGALSVQMPDDTGTLQTLLISGIPAGTYLPIAVTRLRATGSTATLVIAFF